MDGLRDEIGREAVVILLDGWQGPKPESAVGTVRVVAALEAAARAPDAGAQ